MSKRSHVLTLSSSPPSVASSSKRIKPSSPDDDDDGVINLVSSSPVPRRKSKPAALVTTSSEDSFAPTQQRRKASKEKVRKSKGKKLPMWEDLKGIKKGWRKRRGELRGLPLEVMDRSAGSPYRLLASQADTSVLRCIRIVSFDSDLDVSAPT